MFSLKPPRHISTLPKPEVDPPERHVRSTTLNIRRHWTSPAGPGCADTVAKVFFWEGTLILRAGARTIENDVGDHAPMRQTHRRFR
jgi:hypothetical protein